MLPCEFQPFGTRAADQNPTAGFLRVVTDKGLAILVVVDDQDQATRQVALQREIFARGRSHEEFGNCCVAMRRARRCGPVELL
jgi:hypothetical protein